MNSMLSFLGSVFPLIYRMGKKIFSNFSKLPLKITGIKKTSVSHKHFQRSPSSVFPKKINRNELTL